VARDASGEWRLRVGAGPVIEGRISVPGCLGFWELIEEPRFVDSEPVVLRYSRPFVRALMKVMPLDAERGRRLVADFENSFANLVLNRVVARSRRRLEQAIEPCFDGHYIHPFPGLRTGPTPEMVDACSNLSTTPVSLQLLEVPSALLFSSVFHSASSCARVSLGCETGARDVACIPVHPWQFTLSSTVGALIQLEQSSISEQRVDVQPLASQRTCRVIATGFDLKLPIDATITGEHRLLYAANVRNAPAVSAVARSAVEDLQQGAPDHRKTLELQYDIASITHPDPVIGRHVSAIVRAPVPTVAGTSLISALQLWASATTATSILALEHPGAVYEVFERYCMLLMRGPVELYWRYGLAVEPHVQNTLVRIRDGIPVSIVLRDLDGTILDREPVSEQLRRLGLDLPVASWNQFPTFEAGGQRLGHSILHAHLAIVEARLLQLEDVERSVLADILEDVWTQLLHETPTKNRRAVNRIRSCLGEVKCLLGMRLNDVPDMVFQRHRVA
jgi:hypothetical protein